MSNQEILKELPEKVFPNITPDWTILGTAARLEKEIGEGFEFKGPGWYLDPDGAAVLILPEEAPSVREIFKKSWPKDTIFKFHYYSHNPGAYFGEMAMAPVRKDYRDKAEAAQLLKSEGSIPLSSAETAPHQPWCQGFRRDLCNCRGQVQKPEEDGPPLQAFNFGKL